MDVFKIQKLYFGFYEIFKKDRIAKYVKKQTKQHINTQFRLTKEQENEALSFFQPYGKVTTLFHRFYTEKTGVFSPLYLPTDLYINVIDEYFNNRKESQVMDNKCYYPMLFHNARIKQADSLAFRINGFWFDEDMKMIKQEQLREILDCEEAAFVKKATSSYGGKGVQFISAKDASLYGEVVKSISDITGDVVVQKPIRQHKSMAAINESSVNTIRILSLLSENGVKIYSSVLRMGVAGSKVDNASSGGITCGITEDGRLRKYAYRTSGEKYEKHPTSGLVFDGYEIFNFKAAKELVMIAHPLVSHFRMVSWDIAIDENGEPVMIEANFAKGELDFHQLNNGPLFGEDTAMILDEVFGKKKG